MAITRANHELVTVAWLKRVTGLATVNTTVPEDSGTWWSTGFLQPAVIKSETNRYYQLRSCIVVVHCWAARQDITSQRPPWGQANDLAENVAAACFDPDLFQVDTLSLGVPGAPSVRVMQAALIEDPMRAPNDDAHMAHYTTTVQLWWTERP